MRSMQFNSQVVYHASVLDGPTVRSSRAFTDKFFVRYQTELNILPLVKIRSSLACWRKCVRLKVLLIYTTNNRQSIVVNVEFTMLCSQTVQLCFLSDANEYQLR